MNSNNHTGTLYSFTNNNEDWWFHTTDHKVLKELAIEGVIAEGSKVDIEGKTYKIFRVAAEILAGVGDNANEFHRGEVNPYSIQLFVYVK